MNYLAIKDLNEPSRVSEALVTYGTAFVTDNGKPIAIMMEITPDDEPLELERAMHLARGKIAIAAIREQSRRNGVAKMSQEDIQAEIAAVRAERKKRA